MAYYPVEIDLGPLPEFPRGTKTYDFSSYLPAQSREILLYSFATTHAKGPFQRGYYEISTKNGDYQFKQYLNIATGKDVAAVNSENMWFPFGEGKVTITLIHPQDEKVSVAYKTTEESAQKNPHGQWSSVFVTGYRI